MQTQSYEAINLTQYSAKTRYYLLLIILTMMSVAGLVGSDVYLPAMPIIGRYFQASTESMQLTLGLYLFGLSVSQLIYGPLSDKFGRKWPLVFGMSLYFLASLVCLSTTKFNIFLAARFFQAVGACSGLTIGRAIIGDLFDSKESAKVFSTIFPFVGMSPAISPVIGGFLTEFAGWRATFVFIVLFSFILCLAVLFLLRESIAIEHQQKAPTHPLHIIRNYFSLLSSHRFWLYALIPCVAYIAYFGYISESPFIFYQHGFTAHIIGLFYITLSITYVAGNLLGRRVLNFLDLNKSLFIGYTICTIGALCIFLVGLLGQFSLILMISSISILTFGNGFLIPQGTAGVISHFQTNRGLASGLLGFLQLGSAAISASIIGTVSQGALLGLGLYTLFICAVGFSLFLFFIRSSKKG